MNKQILPEYEQIKQWEQQAAAENKVLILLVAGDSASGKSSRMKLLNYHKILTTTTRPKRPGEINGVDYDFMSEEDFIIARNKNLFLETTTYGWYHYGTKLKQFTDQLNKKRPCFLILDTAGLINVKNELQLNHKDSFLVKSIYYRINKDTFSKRISKRGEKITKEYLNERWGANEFAHLTLKNNPNLVDLIVDANENIKSFEPNLKNK